MSRNSLETSGYSSLDLRASRDLRIGGTTQAPRTITLAVDAFNVLNQVNYGSFVGTVDSPLFGLPVSAQPPRQTASALCRANVLAASIPFLFGQQQCRCSRSAVRIS